MPRAARKKSVTGIYHTMLRGIDKGDIFKNDQDYHKFLYYLTKAREKSEFEIYAYCLLPNHIHLLIKAENGSIGTIMSRITVGYVQYFNYQNNRTGHLFQNRFKSETVEDDTYFLTVIRYIHWNPVKAGLARNIQDYPWSSYAAFLKPTQNNDPFLNIPFVIGMFGDRSEFLSYMTQDTPDTCLDFTEHRRLTDNQLIEMITEVAGTNDIKLLKKAQKVEIIRDIQQKTNASLRQLNRILHVGH